MAERINIGFSSQTLVAGDDHRFRFSATVDDQGTPKNLSSATIVFALAESEGGPAFLTKTVGSGVTVTDALGGIFEVHLDEADTADRPGDFFYVARVTDVSGETKSGTIGNIRFFPRITIP